jgi:hypothetical protein
MATLWDVAVATPHLKSITRALLRFDRLFSCLRAILCKRYCRSVIFSYPVELCELRLASRKDWRGCVRYPELLNEICFLV